MKRPLKMTPMLEQYFELKRQSPDTILFFRLGDFYEMFFEDAEKAAPLLDLVLTARGKGGESEAPMCGVPYHSAEQYVAKLVRRGLSVAICEQVEDPSDGKGIVRREIVRVVTPGTAIEGSVVDRESCYLLGLAEQDGSVGAAWLDVSTGDFFVTAYDADSPSRLTDDLARFAPREVVIRRSGEVPLSDVLSASGLTISHEEDSWFEPRNAVEYLTRHFQTQSLSGFGLDEGDVRTAAAGAALRYAASRHRRDLDHIRRLRVDREAGILLIDASSLRNLEIFESREAGESRATLWNVVHATRTAMGSRLLRHWMSRPSSRREEIFDRHDAVDELSRQPVLLDRLVRHLQSIGDLERLTARVTLRSASPRECVTLADSLRTVDALRGEMAALSGPLLSSIRELLDPVEAASDEITRTLGDAPPQSVRDGGAIREGVDSELDELRRIARDSKSILLEIESEEREKTSIPSLKIRYNNVFGYYIEVSKANLAKVPEHYIRKQTLVNAERYITPRLKELEEKILGAEERSLALESRIYDALLGRVSEQAERVLATARRTAEADVLAALASVAIRRRWTRPVLSDAIELVIEQGRHPVVEAISSERFVPNDTSIRQEENGIQIVTGPNMGGKSTYLRQVALTVLLSQMGSFVPASSARLGIFDRIFTRVGASDHLARGESTFMVEMQETANILNNATSRSLVILDEVGRGTATFDGLSIAWAVIEHLHDVNGSITLFATHYHELTDLARTRERVSNCSVAVREWKDQIIFLRRVVPGAADKSYGIQVAKLAGIPLLVTQRAREILHALERKEDDVVDEARRTQAAAPPRTESTQMTLFGVQEQEVIRLLREIDLDAVSPIEALNRLHEIKRRLME